VKKIGSIVIIWALALAPAHAIGTCANWGHASGRPASIAAGTCQQALKPLETRAEFIADYRSSIIWQSEAQKLAVKYKEVVDLSKYPDQKNPLDVQFYTKKAGLVYDYCQAHPTVDYWDALQITDQSLPCPRWHR
jgi:hypothetical protein